MASKKTKLEKIFQANLIGELKNLFEGCMIIKPDPRVTQGIPDLLILYKNHWAALECKRSRKASKRPNQQMYVNKMNGMSFASFIYPENKKEVLDDLQRAFRS